MVLTATPKADIQAPATDAELVRSVMLQQKSGFRQLYSRYAADLYRAIYLILRDEEMAGYILTVTYQDIWKQIKNFRPEQGSLYFWMCWKAISNAKAFRC